jgi:hypothetical protein
MSALARRPVRASTYKRSALRTSGPRSALRTEPAAASGDKRRLLAAQDAGWTRNTSLGAGADGGRVGADMSWQASRMRHHAGERCPLWLTFGPMGLPMPRRERFEELGAPPLQVAAELADLG